MRASVATQGDTCPHFFVIIYTLSYSRSLYFSFSFITLFILVHNEFQSLSLHISFSFIIIFILFHYIVSILHCTSRGDDTCATLFITDLDKINAHLFRFVIFLFYLCNIVPQTLTYVMSPQSLRQHGTTQCTTRLDLMVSCDTTLTRFNRDTTGKA